MAPLPFQMARPDSQTAPLSGPAAAPLKQMALLSTVSLNHSGSNLSLTNSRPTTDIRVQTNREDQTRGQNSRRRQQRRLQRWTAKGRQKHKLQCGISFETRSDTTTADGATHPSPIQRPKNPSPACRAREEWKGFKDLVRILEIEIFYQVLVDKSAATGLHFLLSI